MNQWVGTDGVEVIDLTVGSSESSCSYSSPIGVECYPGEDVNPRVTATSTATANASGMSSSPARRAVPKSMWECEFHSRKETSTTVPPTLPRGSEQKSVRVRQTGAASRGTDNASARHQNETRGSSIYLLGELFVEASPRGDQKGNHATERATPLTGAPSTGSGDDFWRGIGRQSSDFKDMASENGWLPFSTTREVTSRARDGGPSVSECAPESASAERGNRSSFSARARETKATEVSPMDEWNRLFATVPPEAAAGVDGSGARRSHRDTSRHYAASPASCAASGPKRQPASANRVESAGTATRQDSCEMAPQRPSSSTASSGASPKARRPRWLKASDARNGTPAQGRKRPARPRGPVAQEQKRQRTSHSHSMPSEAAAASEGRDRSHPNREPGRRKEACAQPRRRMPHQKPAAKPGKDWISSLFNTPKRGSADFAAEQDRLLHEAAHNMQPELSQDRSRRRVLNRLNDRILSLDEEEERSRRMEHDAFAAIREMDAQLLDRNPPCRGGPSLVHTILRESCEPRAVSSGNPIRPSRNVLPDAIVETLSVEEALAWVIAAPEATKDPLRVLGLGDEDVRRRQKPRRRVRERYRKLARYVHPDKGRAPAGGQSDAFQKLTTAYHELLAILPDDALD